MHSLFRLDTFYDFKREVFPLKTKYHCFKLKSN